MKDITKGLVARRVLVGADSPEGRRCSNLAGQISTLPIAESDWQRSNLIEAMRRQAASIEQIRRDGGQYIHANHGAGR